MRVHLIVMKKKNERDSCPDKLLICVGRDKKKNKKKSTPAIYI